MAHPGAQPLEATRVDPGVLYSAPAGTTLPADLTTALDGAFVPLGYTNEGHEFEGTPTFEDVRVAEEIVSLATYKTDEVLNWRFAARQLNAANLQLAFGGGTIDATLETNTVTKYTPPGAGVFTPVILVWEATDGLERWVYKRCIQVGTVNIPRRQAPDAAMIPMDFRLLVPTDASPPFEVYYDSDFTS